MKLQCNVPCRTVAYSSSFFGRFNFCGPCVFVVLFVVVSDVWLFTFLAVVIRDFVRAGF